MSMNLDETTDEQIILYGHMACPQLPPVMGMLNQTKAAYKYINIREDVDAAATVREINNGYESVPTLVFPDGSILTEPSERDLRHKLEAMGLHVPWTARIMGNMWFVFGFVMIAWAILSALGVL